MRGSAVLVVRQGFGGIGTKEDIWIILRRTPMYIYPTRKEPTYSDFPRTFIGLFGATWELAEKAS